MFTVRCSFYATAHDACRATRTGLEALDLKPEELESVNSADGLDILMQKIQQTIEVQEQTSRRRPIVKKTGKFVNIFSEFVIRTSGIIELMLPQSPEYRVTYGVLLLVFKTVFKRKETQESLLAYIEKLSFKLPIIDFYGKVSPTNGMKLRVASMYVEILNLLNEAIIYYRKDHLRQLCDAVLRPVETKFDKCIQRIEIEVDKLNELKAAAHVARQADMKEFLESTGQVVARMHHDLNHSMTAFGSCLAILDNRIEDIAAQSSAVFAYQATNNAIALAEVLLPAADTAMEQLSLVRQQRFRLSPKDHWYDNGVVRAFEEWSACGREELLWIGGRSGNQDTWITEMSIALTDALRMQNLTLLHEFCSTEEPPTVTTLMKRLIAQLLDLHPDIAFRRPKTFNIRRFRRATTFFQLWPIFEALVSEIPNSVFVLIDRIEDCDADADENGGADVVHDLLPYLMGLVSDADHVSVIVTSTFPGPEKLEGEELRVFWKDTKNTKKKRER